MLVHLSGYHILVYPFRYHSPGTPQWVPLSWYSPMATPILVHPETSQPTQIFVNLRTSLSMLDIRYTLNMYFHHVTSAWLLTSFFLPYRYVSPGTTYGYLYPGTFLCILLSWYTLMNISVLVQPKNTSTSTTPH
jgi:hypothetical protein